VTIAFTTSGRDLGARLDSRFGRAAQFLVYDLDQNTYRLVDNQPGQDAAQGAGIQAAETMARLGVGGLVTGHCGPNAVRVLRAAGIAIYTTDVPTVADALEAFRAGTLARIDSADVEGHWT
jgi:predicted Fe-Mo cluster-binding NifX family protein